MKQVALGKQGLRVSALGLGCMSLLNFHAGSNESESLATLSRALDLGVNFFDTADVYGPFTNEEFIGRAIKGRRDKVVLATKFGEQIDPNNKRMRIINGKPDYVRAACENSLRRLQVETIDLYYQHRVDPETPIEDTVGAMARLVEQGKVRFLGLSEASPETIRRAHAVHPISALQSEFSLLTRDPEEQVFKVCEDLGIGFVAYRPLSRGLLTGQFKKPQDLPEDDYRRSSPRFQSENLARNLELIARIDAIAKKKRCLLSQLALAWILAQGRGIVPIAGTKRRKHLEENIGALAVELSPDELRNIDETMPRGAASGLRYPEAAMKSVNR